MITRREFDLLADIAKLLNKYGPEVFEALAYTITSPATTQALAEVLQASAQMFRTTPLSSGEVGGGKTTRSVRGEIASLETVDPEKYVILTDLYQALQEKSVLPTLADVRNSISDSGLPPIKVDARQKAINPLIRELIQLPTNELAEKLHGLPLSSNNDRSLQGWSEIILGKERAGRA